MRNAILDMVDEMIDGDGDVRIGTLTFQRSTILRECDPTAYRIMVNEVIDTMIEDFEYDIDRLDPELDADEIADIHVQIAELQEFAF